MAEKEWKGKEHLCVDGKWQPGEVKDCPKHEKIKKRRMVPGAQA